MIITSNANPLIKRIIGLQQKKQQRYEQNCFVIEGRKEIDCAREGGIEFEAIVHCPDIYDDFYHQDDCSLWQVSAGVYEKIAYRGNVEGLIAIAKIPSGSIESLLLPKNPLILVAQGLEKPGNLGALLRTADAAGVNALIVAGDNTVDIYNPNVVRASIGAIFTVPTFALSLEQTRLWLEKNKIKAVLTCPQATDNYTNIDYNVGVAIVLGSEHDGLPDSWLSQADCKVKIPMLGQMDSLNVSCSAAIMLYEALRQRTV